MSWMTDQSLMMSRYSGKTMYLPRMGVGILYSLPSSVLTLSWFGSAVFFSDMMLRPAKTVLGSYSECSGVLGGLNSRRGRPDVSCAKLQALCICEDVIEHDGSHPRVFCAEILAKDAICASAAGDD